MGVANWGSEKRGGKRSGAWHIERGLADCGRQSKRTFSMTAISACKYRKDEKQQREGKSRKSGNWEAARIRTTCYTQHPHSTHTQPELTVCNCNSHKFSSILVFGFSAWTLPLILPSMHPAHPAELSQRFATLALFKYLHDFRLLALLSFKMAATHTQM